MTLSGKDKTNLLIALLENKAKRVLDFLPSDVSHKVTSLVGNTPELNQKELNLFIQDVLHKLETVEKEPIQEEALNDDPDTSSILEPENDVMTSEKEAVVSDEIKETSEAEVVDLSEAADLSPWDPSWRSPTEIARFLSREKPQIIAFFLSKLEDAQAEEIIQHFSKELKRKLGKVSIDFIPLSETVFKKLYEKICVMPVEEEVPV